MMEQVAKVIGNEEPGWLMVEVEMKSACDHCASSDSCGSGAIAKAFPEKVQRFSIATDRQCKVGELLKLGLPESVVLKAAALVYLLPLAGLLFGGLVAQMLGANLAFGSDLWVMAASLCGGLLCWKAGKHWARTLEQGAQPVILAYLGPQIPDAGSCCH